MSRLRSRHWREVNRGERCDRCGHKRFPMLVAVRVNNYRGWNGEQVTECFPIARCLNREACAARVRAQDAARRRTEERQRRRSGAFTLEQPKAPDAPQGFCQWCGEEIVLIDPVGGYRFKQRRHHRGDEHETGKRDCYTEYLGSRCWSARDAVERVEKRLHGKIVCRACGLVCRDSANRLTGHAWEADHIVALEDGGEHSLENLQPLCVGCHHAKSARENAARRLRKPVAA